MRKELKDVTEEFMDWLQNYRTADAILKLVCGTLAALPGGDELEDAGYAPVDGIGWHEFDLIGRLFTAIEDKRDIEEFSEMLLRDGDDEDYDEEDDNE